MNKYNFVSIKFKQKEERLRELNTLKEFYKYNKKINSQEKKEILSKIKQIKEILEQ